MTFKGPFDPNYGSVTGTPAGMSIRCVLGVWKKLLQQGVVGLTRDI